MQERCDAVPQHVVVLHANWRALVRASASSRFPRDAQHQTSRSSALSETYIKSSFHQGRMFQTAHDGAMRCHICAVERRVYLRCATNKILRGGWGGWAS
jgi:hypothetical protein